MRIMKGRSSDPTYHVIQDVKKNGKRSTEIIENLGRASEIAEEARYDGFYAVCTNLDDSPAEIPY